MDGEEEIEEGGDEELAEELAEKEVRRKDKKMIDDEDKLDKKYV